MYEKKVGERRLHEQVSGPMREMREAELPFWMSEGKRTSQKWLSSSKMENDHIRRAQYKTSPPSWKMVIAISTFQFFQKNYWTRYPQRCLGLVKTHAILQEGERNLSWMSPPHDNKWVSTVWQSVFLNSCSMMLKTEYIEPRTKWQRAKVDWRKTTPEWQEHQKEQCYFLIWVIRKRVYFLSR